MKKIWYCLFAIALFLNAKVVFAAIENKCNYEGEIVVPGKGSETVGDTFIMSCDFYDDGSNADCIFSTNTIDTNAESFTNWKSDDQKALKIKDWYLANRTCIPYVVFVHKNRIVNGYAIAGFYDHSQAVLYAQEQSKWYHASVVQETGLVPDIINDIKEYNKMLEDFGTNFELDKYCKLDSKSGQYISDDTNDVLCYDALNAARNTMKKWEQEVRNAINKGVITGKEDVVIKFYDLYNKCIVKLGPEWSGTKPPQDPTVENPGNPTTDPDKPGTDPTTTTTSRTCISCGSVDNLPVQLPTFIRNLITVIQVLVPVLLILLGIYDFIRAVISNDEKQMKEAQNRFIRRTIGAVLIFFLVALVRFGFMLVPGQTEILGCISCFTTDGKNCSNEYTCNTTSWTTTYKDNSIVTTGGPSNTPTNPTNPSTPSTNTPSKPDQIALDCAKITDQKTCIAQDACSWVYDGTGICKRVNCWYCPTTDGSEDHFWQVDQPSGKTNCQKVSAISKTTCFEG